jgi:reverse gyrase
MKELSLSFIPDSITLKAIQRCELCNSKNVEYFNCPHCEVKNVVWGTKEVKNIRNTLSEKC